MKPVRSKRTTTIRITKDLQRLLIATGRTLAGRYTDVPVTVRYEDVIRAALTSLARDGR